MVHTTTNRKAMKTTTTTYDDELTAKNKRAREEKVRKKLQQLIEAIKNNSKTWMEVIQQIALDFEEAGTIPTDRICLEIIKSLREVIDQGLVTANYVRLVLDAKYKMQTQARYGSRNISTRQKQHKDAAQLLNHGIDLIEMVSGLKFEQIKEMPVSELITKYREYYTVQLKSLIDKEVHLQGIVLHYLAPLVRDMVDITDTERGTLRYKEQSGIGQR